MPHGRDQLRDWIKRREFTQREAAAYMGFDETVLSAILSGRRSPGLTNAVTLERATGIPVEAWMASELDESHAPISENTGSPNIDKVQR